MAYGNEIQATRMDFRPAPHLWRPGETLRSLLRTLGRIADHLMRRLVSGVGGSIQGGAGIAASGDHRRCQENDNPSRKDTQFLLAKLAGWGYQLVSERRSTACNPPAGGLHCGG